MENGGKLDLSQLRNLIRQYIDNHLYDTALYWADKVCTLSGGETQDIVWLSNAMYHTNQYRRVIDLLKTKELVQDNIEARYLVAKCYAALKEWDEVLDVIEGGQIANRVTSCTSDGDSSIKLEGTVPVTNRKIESAIAYLKGKAYESQGVRYKELAVEAYREALMLDVYCFEAFDALISHYMLTSQEELDLLSSLPIKEQCSVSEGELIKFVYNNSIKKYSKPLDYKLAAPLRPLAENFDMVVCSAEKHFNSFDYRTCFEMTSKVMQQSPFHEKCIPLYIACLYELGKKNLLFDLAERLVKNYPERPISWYCIGTYYLLIGKNEAARRYFSKSTTLDHIYAPAWLGFAHSYANEGEHDQAISAYFTASKLMPGSHLPFLYLGLEYVVTHNIRLAKRYFQEALAISPDDPHVKHELGTVAYQNGEYQAAERYYKEALQKVTSACGNFIPEMWEPLLNNLGHVYRKLGDFESSLSYHKKALQVLPHHGSSHASIGLVNCYLGNFSLAISSFHKSLSLKRDDTISSSLLSQALDSDASELSMVMEEAEEKMEDSLDQTVVSDAGNVSMDLEESFSS